MAEPLQPGQMLRDKWRIDSFLGEGGMSRVYAATHRNGARAAIKVLHPELGSNKTVRARFLREGYVANKVDHPGAVRVLDDDATEEGLVFLVMELLEGITLKKRWVDDERQMEVTAVLDIVEQVLDVLESAHRHGIVHRDLKPDNIFLLKNGSAKVLDFGIARILESALEGNDGATSSGAMLGTPAFMAPEQALAHWDDVDGRTDLFALAATAYTVLSGKLIHSGSTVPELLVAAATRTVKPMRTVMPDLADGVAEVLDRALRFDIGQRWPDARSMRLALVEAKSRVVTTATVRLTVSQELLEASSHGGRAVDAVSSPGPVTGIDGPVAFAETGAFDPEATTSAGTPGGFTQIMPLLGGALGGAAVAPAAWQASSSGLQGAIRAEHVAGLSDVTHGAASTTKGVAPWIWVGLAAGVAGIVATVFLVRGSPAPQEGQAPPASSSGSPSVAPVATVTPVAPVETAIGSVEAPPSSVSVEPTLPPAPGASADAAPRASTPRPPRPRASSQGTAPGPCKRDPMTRKCLP